MFNMLWKSILLQETEAYLLTSFSPTKTITFRPPFGSTCAKSPRRSEDLLSLFKCTLTFSSISGLNLPPVRSLDRSFLSFSMAFSMPASSGEKSNGSSTSADDSEATSALSRSALPFFFRWNGVCEKLLERIVVCGIALEG